jgi:hypothetical protein
MSPIDDELRSLLQSRAAEVAPAPDPLQGITSRAHGIRRRRATGAAAGAAAVVVAIAVGVPLLVSGNDSDAVRQPVSTPSAVTPSAGTDTAAGTLDLTDPWPLRGPAPHDLMTHNAMSAWSQGEHAGGAVTPLFVRAMGDLQESFYLGTSSSGNGLVHVLETSQNASTTDLAPLPDDTRALTFVGDSTDGRGELVVIAAPDATVEYASNGRGYQQISDVGQAPAGIGLVPIEGDDPNDTIRVTEANGTTLVQDAPNWVPPAGSPPSNLVTWIHRGDASLRPPTAEVLHAFTVASGHSDDAKSHYVPLYDGSVSGVHYTIGQAYYDGDTKAHTFGYVTGGSGGAQAFYGPATPMDTDLIALLVDGIPGSSTDLLVLVPRPGTGQLSYSPDGTTRFQAVASGRSDLNGVGLVDRSKTATADRIEQLDGDGNIDRPIYRGPVAPFLCGDKGCG